MLPRLGFTPVPRRQLADAGSVVPDQVAESYAVAPGLVDTASNIAAMKPKDLKRWAKREDIAETVLFLASQAGAGITGQVIAVTGGRL